MSAGTARFPRLSIHHQRGSISEIPKINPPLLCSGSFGISQDVGINKNNRRMKNSSPAMVTRQPLLNRDKRLLRLTVLSIFIGSAIAQLNSPSQQRRA